uniref:Uncharacterized protein n=1 Tax=viral metagenome TaxID=1070528 RepID=A0A2V0RAV8_9ZZZZ
MINGDILPGKIHTLIMSDKQLKRNYRFARGIYVDTNLRNTSPHVLQFIYDNGYSYVSLLNDVIVEGRSWEMSAVKSIIDKPGIYSGTVESISNGIANYGTVPGLAIKKRMNVQLKTYEDSKYDLLPR